MSKGFTIRTLVVFISVGLFCIQIVSLFHEGYITSFDTERIDAYHARVINSSSRSETLPLTGDVIDWRKVPVATRIWWTTDNSADESAKLPVLRSGRVAYVNVVAPRFRPDTKDLIQRLIPNLLWKVIFLGIGILVLVKGRGISAVYLAAMCIAWALSGNGSYWASIPSFARLAVVFFDDALFVGACLAYYLFVDAICANIIDPRFSLALRAVVFVLLGYRFIAGNFAVVTFVVAGYGPSFWGLGLAQTLVFLLGMCLSFYAYWKSSGLARRRFAWVFVSCLGLIGPSIANISGTFNLSFGRWQEVINAMTDYSVIVMGFGWAYVVLKHRVADVTVVINRAVVYGVLTAVVVATLSLTEHLVDRLAVGHHSNSVLDLVVPLVLGMCMHPIRIRVEWVVDRLFNFRRARTEDLFTEIESRADEFKTSKSMLEFVISRVRGIFGGTAAIYLTATNRLSKYVQDGSFPMPESIEWSKVGILADAHGLVLPLTLRTQELGALVLRVDEASVPIDAKEQAALRRLTQSLAIEIRIGNTSSARGSAV